jgi:hypothetical protein
MISGFSYHHDWVELLILYAKINAALDVLEEQFCVHFWLLLWVPEQRLKNVADSEGVGE